MLNSMTAFARSNRELGSGVLIWEIRSVNHRYLEPHFRIPDSFREAEAQYRDLLRKRLDRGKLECGLKWQPNLGAQNGVQINDTLLNELSRAITLVASKLDNPAPVDVISVMQWPGLINSEDDDRKHLLQESVAAFDQTLSILIDNRQREGAQLAPLFEQRLSAIDAIVAEVRRQLPGILQAQANQIRQRFEEARIEPDSTRLEQEMVLLAQKSDVAEELDRLDTHVKEVRAVLKRKEPVGRRLDFLMQELNREANTLSSKAIVTDTTKAAVELKVLIEQMREQVQNIE
jgi:uncharacterized protein (TIGR00255 family)